MTKSISLNHHVITHDKLTLQLPSMVINGERRREREIEGEKERPLVTEESLLSNVYTKGNKA